MVRVYIDLIGLYYCIEKCKNIEVAGNLRHELLARYLNLIKKVEIIKVWDKNVNVGEEILRFMNEITGYLIHHTDIHEVRECNEGKNNCDFVECKMHKAYCCMCDISKDDILVSIKAGSEVVCFNQSSIKMNDGIKYPSSSDVGLKPYCNDLDDYINCKIVICRCV